MKSYRQVKRRQEQGIAHVGVVLLVVVVLAVIGFAGYTVYKKTGSGVKASTTTTKTTETAAADQGCVATYKDENLCKFAANGGVLDKLKFKATISASGGASALYTVMSDGKGNMSIHTTAEDAVVDTVIYDHHSYIKNDQGSWTDYGTDTEEDTNPTKDMNLVLGSGLTYTPQGKEACGSLTCFKYKLKDANTPNDDQTVWFDTKSYLARKWEDVFTDSDTGLATTTTMTIDYSGNVSVSKPSPVVPLN